MAENIASLQIEVQARMSEAVNSIQGLIDTMRELGDVSDSVLKKHDSAVAKAASKKKVKTVEEAYWQSGAGKLFKNMESGGLVGGITKTIGQQPATGAMGAIGKMMGPLTMIGGAVTIIVGILMEASPMLKSMIGGILKLLMLILKPIGDILGVILYPLMLILMPVVRALNMLFRPYLQKAMEAMAVGMKLTAAGLTSGDPAALVAAGEAFSAAFSYILKPFQDMLIDVVTGAVQMINMVLGLFWSLILQIFGFEDAANDVINIIMEGNAAISDFATFLKETSTTMIDAQLATATIYAFNIGAINENMFNKIKESIEKTSPIVAQGMEDLKGNFGAGMKSLMAINTLEMANAMLDIGEKWSDFKEKLGEHIKNIGEDFVKLLTDLGLFNEAIKATQIVIEGVTAAIKLIYQILYYMGGKLLGMESPSTAFTPQDDFVWRPGGNPVAINPSDTLVGFKGNGGLGGSVYAPTINITVQGHVLNEQSMRELATKVTDFQKQNYDQFKGGRF